MEEFAGSLSGLLVILFLSSFVKIATALNVVRYGLGLGGGGIGLIVLILSFSLALVPVSEPLNEMGGLNSLMTGRPINGTRALELFAPFIRSHTDAEILGRLRKGDTQQKKGEVDKVGTKAAETLKSIEPLELAAFLVTSVGDAFRIALLLIIPFLVVDLFVANLLMALGVGQMSVAAVSMPLKLLLLVSVGGWSLIVERILS